MNIKKRKKVECAEIVGRTGSNLQPLVNPTMDEAKTYRYDRPVQFDDMDYAEQWITELMSREDNI